MRDWVQGLLYDDIVVSSHAIWRTLNVKDLWIDVLTNQLMSLFNIKLGRHMIIVRLRQLATWLGLSNMVLFVSMVILEYLLVHCLF